MAWTPSTNTIDFREVVDNFFAYVRENQTDALDWANDSATPKLKNWQEFHISIAGRLTTIFPCLMIVNKEAATDLDSDDLSAGLRITLETIIESGDRIGIVRNAEKYAMALESLIVNCPKTTWFQNSKITLLADVLAVETSFDELGTINSAFYQVFQTRFTLQIRGSSYGD